MTALGVLGFIISAFNFYFTFHINQEAEREKIAAKEEQERRDIFQGYWLGKRVEMLDLAHDNYSQSGYRSNTTADFNLTLYEAGVNASALNVNMDRVEKIAFGVSPANSKAEVEAIYSGIRTSLNDQGKNRAADAFELGRLLGGLKADSARLSHQQIKYTVTKKEVGKRRTIWVGQSVEARALNPLLAELELGIQVNVPLLYVFPDGSRIITPNGKLVETVNDQNRDAKLDALMNAVESELKP